MSLEDEHRLHRCCFTGHRPEKLDRPAQVIIAALEQEIRAAVDDGFVTFISGMARGVDIWAAEIVIQLKAEGLPLHLVCASPFQGFESRWSQEWKWRYSAVLDAADLVKYICPRYSRDCFQVRNEWIVARSSRVIAVYDGQAGGTKNTIDFAIRTGVQVRFI